MRKSNEAFRLETEIPMTLKVQLNQSPKVLQINTPKHEPREEKTKTTQVIIPPVKPKEIIIRAPSRIKKPSKRPLAGPLENPSAKARYSTYLQDTFSLYANKRCNPAVIEERESKNVFKKLALADDAFHSRMFQHLCRHRKSGISYKDFADTMALIEYGNMTDQLRFLLTIYNLSVPGKWIPLSPNEVDRITLDSSVDYNDTIHVLWKTELLEILFHGILICTNNVSSATFEPSVSKLVP